MAAPRLSVLHLAPHPDDESIGAPATLMALRDAGHRVLNLVCSLGSQDPVRRAAELEAAMRLARYEFAVLDPPLRISRGDDLALAEETLIAQVRSLVREQRFDLVLSPTPHDGHHGHELVGRAVGRAIAGLPDPRPHWWMWSLWADLPLPTLFVPFGEDRMAEILWVLSQYRGELARSDYRAVVHGRSRAFRVQGVERVFGFGEPRAGGAHAHLRTDPRPYAELLTEAVHRDGQWRLAAPRVPAFDDPIGSVRPGVPLGWWIDEPSVRARAAPPHLPD